MKDKGFATELLTPRTLQKKQAHPAPPTQEAINQITVTLLLTGGQQYTVTIPPDSSLLQDLCETLMAREPHLVKRLFQIPINNGRAMLAFPSDRLVGLVTEPPLMMQYPSITPVQHTEQPSQSTDGNLIISDYLQINNFLSSDEHQQLLQYVMQREKDFVSTTTFTQQKDYRQSVVLHSFPEFTDLMTQRVQAYLPKVLKVFRIQSFPISQIEAQLTAHNDGHFYKVHNDNGSPDAATRELTYVYYFNREPKAYTGGELIIYDSKIHSGRYVQADTFSTIEPHNNSIVFFFSRCMHEVKPIQCPSKTFADSRFTINGWIRRF